MNKYFAELIGTFVLVFASCGAAVLAGDKIGFLGVSLAFGFSIAAISPADSYITAGVTIASVIAYLSVWLNAMQRIWRPVLPALTPLSRP